MTWSENLGALKSMATDAAQAVGKKTKELASAAKVNFAIRTEEEKIKKAQLELGKLYYRDFVVGEEPDAAEYLPWCEKITESKQTIEDLKASLEEGKTEEAEPEECQTAEETKEESYEVAAEEDVVMPQEPEVQEEQE